MRSITLSVPTAAVLTRLDLFLAANLHGVSRGRVKSLIKAERVQVDGEVAFEAGRTLQPGERVTVALEAKAIERPERIQRSALQCAGTDWWVMHKPVLVPAQNDDFEGPGVADRARKLTGGAHHLTVRGTLETATSGLVWVGRKTVADAVTVAIQKVLAIVSPAPDDARADVPGTDWSFEVVRRGDDGHRAELALSRSDGSASADDSDLQAGLRAALAAAGWPVLGDLDNTDPLPGGAARMAWHVAGIQWLGIGEEDGAAEVAPEDGWEELLHPSQRPAPALQTPRAKPKKTGKRRSRAEAPTPITSGLGREGADATLAAGGQAADRFAWNPLDERRGWAPTGGEEDPLPSGPAKRIRRLLKISRPSAAILASGQPWVMPDRETGPRHTLRAGEMVDLVDGEGEFIAVALVDPSQRICARVLSGCDANTGVFEFADWRARADEAIGRRDELIDEPGTDAIRLIHGHADGLPGLWVDLWGTCVVATRLSRCAEAFTEAVYSAVAERFPSLPIYEKDHLADVRAAEGGGGALTGRWVKRPAEGHPAATGTWTVQELGATFEVQPTGDLTTGFYPDQRDNRRQLKAWVAGRDHLVAANLFAHTGAFSVSLALAGVERVHTIDLSPLYLDWYRRNLALNGLSEEDHPVIAGDSLKWLEGAPPLDLAILDPPSFAKARGRSGSSWNAQRDYAELVAAAAAVLKPRGVLLCCHNLRGAKNGWLRSQVEKGLWKADRTLSRSETVLPASDFPIVNGFPEGRTFRGLLVTVR